MFNPNRPLSGVLEFLDPRVGVEAVCTPGDPYGEPVRVRPESGLLIVFPSWLYHWVHPYAGQSPRIAVSFNVTLPAPDTAKTRIIEATADRDVLANPVHLSGGARWLGEKYEHGKLPT
jgi:hypothetical protein